MNDKDQRSTAHLTGQPFVHSTVDIRGSVVIGRGCWIGPNVRLHAGQEWIVIGENTTIEANCVVCTCTNRPTIIGEWVKIGAAVSIEGATINDWAVIGKACVLLSATVVGESALLGDGTFTSPGQVIPERAIVTGRHGRVLETCLDREWRAKPSSRLCQGDPGGACAVGSDSPRHEPFVRSVGEPFGFSVLTRSLGLGAA